MSRIQKVENESDSGTESEKLSSENLQTPDDFITASEGPSLFEIVGLLLSSDSSQDNLKLCETSQTSNEISQPIHETSQPLRETSQPLHEASKPPNETLSNRIKASFPPVSCDKKVSVLVSEGHVQIQPCPDNAQPASVGECYEKKPKENCTNVEIEILRALAVHYTSLPSQDSTHQDVTLQVLSESKNSNIPGCLKDNQLALGRSDDKTVSAVDSTKTHKKALSIVQAIQETVDQETLEIIKKIVKDKFAEKQLSEATQSKQQQQLDIQQDAFIKQYAPVQQCYAGISSQSSDDGAFLAKDIPDCCTETVVPRDTNVYFDTFRYLETLVEEESTSDLALNNDNDKFNTFEDYLKHETNSVDIETLLKDQFIDKSTFRKLLANYLKDKTVLYDAICDVNKCRIKPTTEENVIFRKSGPICLEDFTLSTTVALEEHSINYKREGEVIEIDSRAKSKQRDSYADDELSTYDVGTRREITQSRDDDETLTKLQCTIPKDPSDLGFTLSENKCIKKSSVPGVSVQQTLQGQYLPEEGTCLENFADIKHRDDRDVFSQPPLSTAIDGLEPSCDISLINHGGSLAYDLESARVKSVNLTAEQVYVSAFEVDVNGLSSEPRKDIPIDEVIDKQERVELLLQENSKLEHATVDEVKVANTQDDLAKVYSGIVDTIKEVQVTKEIVENVIVVNSNVGNSIELACSLKTERDVFKANLSVKETSSASLEQGIRSKDNPLGINTETSISIDTTRTNSSNKTEVSLVYKTLDTVHQKMNETAEKEPIIVEEPIIQKEAVKRNSSIATKQLENDIKVTDSDKAVLTPSVAEMKKLFEQKPIMMTPPSLLQASQDEASKTPAARQVNQSADINREAIQTADSARQANQSADNAGAVNQSAVSDREAIQSADTARQVYQSADTARGANQSEENFKFPRKEEVERRSSLEKEILGQLAHRSDNARPSVNYNDPTVKGQGRLEDNKPANVKANVDDPSATQAKEGNQPKNKIVSEKRSGDPHCSECCYRRLSDDHASSHCPCYRRLSDDHASLHCPGYRRLSDDHASSHCPGYRRLSDDHASSHCPEKTHPRYCDGASNTRCVESQTVVQGYPCCCQPEIASKGCCSRNASHHHSCGQPCEQPRCSCPTHPRCSPNQDQACPCSFKASLHQRDICRACGGKLLTENCSFPVQDKSCQKQSERRKSPHREEKDCSCTQRCCHCTKCLHEYSQRCTEDVSDETYTENDATAQTATECFKARLDANYTAIRICFKPNGKLKLCPDDCSCRDALTPDASISLASEVCIEASYAQSDSTSSGETGNRKIKFSSQCDIVPDDDSDDEITGESRV